MNERRRFRARDGVSLDGRGRVAWGGFRSESCKASEISKDDMSDHEILGNQKSILQNQKDILENQQEIKRNQKALEEILSNQKEILKNQKEILANQKEILGAVKK
jgi:hypothetical protein